MGGNRRKGAFFTYFVFDVIDKIKETTPANAAETGMIRVVTPPDEYRLAHDMVFRNEAPIAGIRAVMTVVAHHPVVIHLESIAVGKSSIDIDLSVFHLQIVVFIGTNGTLIDGDILHIELHCGPLFR